AMVLRQPPSFEKAVSVHHSSLSADHRQETERRFADESRAVCVATSTLELGIDIGDIDTTVLYGAPPSHESFLQRIGRGNRRGDQTNVVSLVRPGCPRPLLEALTHVAILERIQNGEIERERCFVLFGAVVQQILSYLHERRGGFVRVAELTEVIASAPHIGRALVEAILSHLAAEGVVTRHGFKNQFGAGDGFHRLVAMRLIHGNYPAASQNVLLIERGREIGRVHPINLLQLESGSRFRFGGRVYRVVRVDRDRIEIDSARADGSVRQLVYPGRAAGIHPSILADVWAILAAGRIKPGIVQLNDESWIAQEVSRLTRYFADGGLPVVLGTEGARHLTLAGQLAYRAIGLVVAPGTE